MRFRVCISATFITRPDPTRPDPTTHPAMPRRKRRDSTDTEADAPAALAVQQAKRARPSSIVLNGEARVQQALEQRDMAELAHLLRDGVSASSAALLEAVRTGQPRAVDMLLRARAPVVVPDAADTEQPLSVALHRDRDYRCRDEIALALVKAGASLDARVPTRADYVRIGQPSSHSVLEMVVTPGSWQLDKLLEAVLQRGGTALVQRDGAAAVRRAALFSGGCNMHAAIRRLFRAGVNPRDPELRGLLQTLLRRHYGCLDHATVALLLECGLPATGPVSVADTCTPLQAALAVRATTDPRPSSVSPEDPELLLLAQRSVAALVRAGADTGRLDDAQRQRMEAALAAVAAADAVAVAEAAAREALHTSRWCCRNEISTAPDCNTRQCGQRFSSYADWKAHRCEDWDQGECAAPCVCGQTPCERCFEVFRPSYEYECGGNCAYTTTDPALALEHRQRCQELWRRRPRAECLCGVRRGAPCPMAPDQQPCFDGSAPQCRHCLEVEQLNAPAGLNPEDDIYHRRRRLCGLAGGVLHEVHMWGSVAGDTDDINDDRQFSALMLFADDAQYEAARADGFCAAAQSLRRNMPARALAYDYQLDAGPTEDPPRLRSLRVMACLNNAAQRHRPVSGERGSMQRIVPFVPAH